MRKIIFKRLQEEIESIDSEIMKKYDQSLKQLFFNKYSKFISCLSESKMDDNKQSIHNYCLKESEKFDKNFKVILSEINEEKKQLYQCLNSNYIRSENDNLESTSNKIILNELDKCYLEFKKNIFLNFQKIQN